MNKHDIAPSFAARLGAGSKGTSDENAGSRGTPSFDNTPKAAIMERRKLSSFLVPT